MIVVSGVLFMSWSTDTSRCSPFKRMLTDAVERQGSGKKIVSLGARSIPVITSFDLAIWAHASCASWLARVESGMTVVNRFVDCKGMGMGIGQYEDGGALASLLHGYTYRRKP